MYIYKDEVKGFVYRKLANYLGTISDEFAQEIVEYFGVNIIERPKISKIEVRDHYSIVIELENCSSISTGSKRFTIFKIDNSFKAFDDEVLVKQIDDIVTSLVEHVKRFKS